MIRRKFNFKFIDLLHVSKGCLFIGNLMDNVSIILGYDHAKFCIFPVLIIVHVYPNIPESYSPFPMAQSPAHL